MTSYTVDPFHQPGPAAAQEHPLDTTVVDTTLLFWLGAAVLGAAASAGFVARLHHRIRWKPTNRPKTDAWQRGRLALVGLTVSLMVLGAGLGGALATTLARAAVASGEVPPLQPWSSSSDLDAAREETGGRGDGGVDDPSPGEAGETPADQIPPDRMPADPMPVDTDRGDVRPADTDPGEPARDGGWAVRVGVFSAEENAEALLGRLETMGMEAFSVARTGTSGRRLHFVYAGRFETRETAEGAAEQVRSAGVDAIVVSFTLPAATPPATPPSEGVR